MRLGQRFPTLWQQWSENKCFPTGRRPGDVLVVWKLDRLGRSLQHLLTIVNTLKDRQVAFRSLTEGMDTST